MQDMQDHDKTPTELHAEVEALRTRVAELEASQTELRRTEQTLQESEIRFRRLTEAAFEGFAVSEAGEFVNVSEQFAALFGYQRDELLGVSASRVIAPEARKDAMGKILSGYDQPYESLCLRKDGTTFPVEVCGKNYTWQGQQLRVTAIRDMTQRKRVEHTLRRRAEELEALQATVLDITIPHDLPTLLETIVERAARLINASGGGLYLCEPDQQQVRCMVSYNTTRDYRGTTLQYGEGASGTVAQSGKPVIIDDYRTWKRRSPIFDAERPFKAVIAAPMIWQGQVIGVIDLLQDAESQTFSQSDLDLLTLFANHAAIAVENTRLHEQAQEEIAERLQLEQQSKERHQYLESLLACAPDAIVTMDAQHCVIEWNPGAEKLFGYSAKEAIGQDLDELIAAPDARMLKEAIGFTQQALSGKPVPFAETVRYRKDGTPVDVILAGSPIIIQDEVVGSVAIYADITEHRHAAEALRRSEAQYRATINSIEDAIHVVDEDLRIILFNESFRKWNEELGLKTDVVGMKILEVFPFLPKEVLQEYEQVFKTGQLFVSEECTRIGDREFTTDTRKIPIFEDDQVIQVITVIRDITERKGAEAERETRVRQQAALIQISADLVATLDETDICQSVVEGLHNALGFDYLSLFLLDEATGDRVLHACAGWPEAPTGWRLPPGQGLSERPLLDGKLHYTPDVTQDPRYIPGIGGRSEVDVPLRSGDRILGVLVVESGQPDDFDQDDFAVLTSAANQAAVALERAKEHQAVKTAETRYQSLFDRVPVGLYRSTPSGELLEVNPALVEMLGYIDPQALLEASALDLYVNPDDRRQWQALLEREGIVSDYEAQLRQYDGTVIWALDRARAVLDAEGQVLYYEGTMEDITEQKRAERALRESETKFRNIVESIPMGMHMYQLESDGRLVFTGANSAADRMLGTDHSQFVGKTLEEAFPGLCETEVPAQYRAVASTGRIWQTDQIAYEEGQISGAFEVHAFQTSPGQMTTAFLDVTDRLRSEEELRQLKEFNESIVQSMAEGIAVQSAEGIFTFVNPAAAAMLGYTPEELVGQHWTRVVPHDQQIVVQIADERRTRGESDRYEVQLVRKDDTQFPVLVSGSSHFDPESEDFDGTLAVFTDISERVQAEERLTRHAQEMAALYETSLEINSKRDLSSLLNAIVERASKLVGARMGGLYLMQPGGEELELAVTFNLPDHYIGTRFQLGEGLSGRVAQTGVPLMVDDYSTWEGQAAPFARGRFRRVLGVPLKSGDRIIGVINVTDDEKIGPFDDDEIRLVSLFADQAAIAIENTRLFEAEARRRREAETLQETTQALSATLDLQKVFELILSKLQQVVPYDSATVQQLEGTRLEIIGGHGFPNLEELLGVGFDLMAQDNPNQEMVRARAPLILDDAPAIYAEFKREPHAQAGTRSWLGVPLFFGDRLIGMIALDKKEPGFYTQEHAKLAMAFAAQAAIAVENARLFEAEREQRELAEALREATAAVNSSLDLEQILDHILEQVGRVIPSDAANVSLIEDNRTHIVRCRGYESFTQAIESIFLPVDDTHGLRYMKETGEAFVVSDTATDPAWLNIPETSWIRSYAGAPIHVRDEVIGFLNVDSATPHFFNQTHADRLRAFADEASLAIENARLFEETRRRAEYLAMLNRTGLDISSALELEGVLDTLYEHLRHIMDVGAFYVALYDEETGRIEFPLLTGITGPGQIEPLNIHDRPGITGHIIDTKKTLYVPDTWATTEGAPYHLISLIDQPARSYIGVPLLVRERVIGVLSVQSYEPSAYTQADLDLLTTLSTQASIAIENARLFQAEREQRELTEALQQATVAVSSTLELEQVLDTILEQVGRVVPNDMANIMLIDGDHVHVVRWHGYDQPDDESRLRSIVFRIADTPNLRQLQETGKAMVIPDTSDYPGWRRGLRQVRAYAGAPIRVRDEIIGFLNIYGRTPDLFNQAHAERLQAFADQASLAIGNARLFRIMEQGKRDWEVTFDAMQDAVALVDRNRRVVRANQAFRDLTQRTFLQIIGHEYLTLLDGELCPEPTCPLEHAWKSSQPATCIHEYGQRVFEVQATLIPVEDVRGVDSSANTVYALRDITEREQAEEALRRRNQELALLNRVIAASAASQDIEWILETVCRELALALDVPQSAAALFDNERTQARVVAEYLAEGRPSALGEIIPAKDNPSIQYLFQHKIPLVVDDAQTDPRLAPIHDLMRRRSTVSLLLLPLIVEGEIVGSLGVDAIEPRPFTADEVDLAQRVAEQVSSALARLRLEETQRHLTAAVEQAAESIIITDTDGDIVYVNPAFERTSGYGRAETLGHNTRFLKSGKHDDAFYRDLWQTITAGQVWQGRFVNRKKDGSLYTEDSTITPVRDPSGQIVNYVAVNHDVTREVQLEEQFRQSQKMEALGQLAGGIAHDFNNLLTVIQLSTRLLQRQLHAEDPLWEHIERIQETGKRAGTLTKQLLSFSRREIIEPRILSLNDVVGDLSRMLKRIIGEDIELVTQLGESLWPVRVDPTQVDQVILNLVVNARDAMPQGGTLIIETSNAYLDETYATTHVDVEPGEYALLSISDTGVGMSEEVQTHVFEPFFTTKERGQGTGLGLAAVFGIVKQNKGHIRFYSKIELGTTFKVYLPRAEVAATRTEHLPSPPLAISLVRGTETILVVEDETEVLNLTVRVLQACGYKVLTAGDGLRALELSREHEGPIHLLITDVVMPRMYGKELAEQLQSERPDMRLLFMSGYPDRAVVQQSVVIPGGAFLSKPFTVEELTQKVRAVLDGRV